MSTTQSAPLITDRTPPAQWIRALQSLLRMQGQLWPWFTGTITILTSIVLAFLYFFDVNVEVSIVHFAYHGGLWFPFSMSVLTAMAMLTGHVANGYTRRAFIRASVVTAILVAVTYAVTLTALVLLEGLLYDHWGWTQGMSGSGGFQTFTGVPWGYLLGVGLVYLAGTLAGLMVGIAYYRFGGWKGTFLLPLTVGPILLMGTLGIDTDSAWSPWEGLGVDAGVWRPVIAITLLVAAVVGYHFMARRVPIASKDA